MNLLEIRDLRVSFKNFAPVKGISMAVKSGEFVGLIGNSGSGKSTVALSILRLQKNTKLVGHIFFNQTDLLSLSENEMVKLRGNKIAMIFQEPMTSLNPLHTAGAQVFEALKLHTDKPTKQRVCDLFRLVELHDTQRLYNAYPHQLSGGQRQRVMIAMALAGNPSLLIADEPTTALDVSVQAQILNLLKTLQQKLGLSILFITHDLDIVRAMADRVYVMKFGKIIATHAPADSEIQQRPPFFKTGDPLLRVQDLSVSYGKFRAVHPVSFDLYPGQTIGILGESGSGKSSLGFAISRLISATGNVILNGDNFFKLRGSALTRARSCLQMVFQDPFSSLNPRLMVEDIIAEGLRIRTHAPVQSQVADVMKKVRLKPELQNRYPHELSGGQRVRVALARALILSPKVLILDEVTSALDIYTQIQLLRLLTELQQEFGLAYIFISHDMKAIRTLSDTVMVMKDGHVVESGPTQHVLEHPKDAYTQQLIKASFLK